MTEQIFIGLGSNLGERKQNLKDAVHALERAGVRVTAVSPVYETEPWGMTDQPAFLNLCVAVRSEREPRALLALLKQIEEEMGREPAGRWGPRLIDLDLLLYGERVVAEEELQVPHPRLAERAFVLAPLAEIAPGRKHPETGQTIDQLLAATGREGVRRLPLPLEWGRRTHVMGILNVPPDSFSGDGVLAADDGLARAVGQAREFVAAGVDIIDIGGESTRPGSNPVSEGEELERVIPVIEAVRAAVHVPISVDTYRAAVAEAALAAGAGWVNDVWGLRMDDALAPLVAAAGCPLVLMHNRSRPKDVAQEERLGGRYVGVHYDDLIADVKRELQESVALALAAGVEREQIIIDPGIGFGKTVSQNVQLIADLGQIRELGYPLLLGTSRKSFIGYTLDLPPDERMEGTAATVAIGIDRGADIVRVHDVKPIVRVARMTDRIVRGT